MAKSGTVPSTGGGGGGGTVGGGTVGGGTGGGIGGIDGGITFIVPTITIAAPPPVATFVLVDPILNNNPIPLVEVPVYENLTLAGTDAGETLLGGMGNDHLDGGLGDDLEIGGAGSDTLTSTSGIDHLAGGTGNDVYVINGGEAHIEDFQGHDIIDASDASGDSYIDLSGGSTSHVEDHDVYINGPGTTAQKLDVQFLQDLTGSFIDDIANVQGLIPNIVAALQAVQPDAMFGVSSFRDKPLGSFGGFGDYVYNADVALTTNAAAVTNAYNAMTATGGSDWAESQIESLMHLALNTAEVGFRPDAARFVVLFTDAPYHVGGEGVAAGVSTSANNGDAVIDLLEDYPLVAQLKTALEAANIIPVFAVTPDVLTVYQDLVTALGRGTVTAITANSADVVAAVSAGMSAATTTYIEDCVGGAGNDTLIGSVYDNSIYGGAGNDRLTGHGGNDKITGGDGTDTATYSGNHADYSVTLLADSTYEVTDLRAGSTDGTDILSGIETLTFADESISLALVDPAAQAAAEAAAAAAAQAAADAAAHAAELAAAEAAAVAAAANAKATANAAAANAKAAADAAIANATATHSAQAAANAYANDATTQAANAASNAAAIITNKAAAQLAALEASVQAAAATAAYVQATTDAANADAAAAAAIAAAQAAATAAAASDVVGATAAKDAALEQAAIVKAAATDAIAQVTLAHDADVAAVAGAQTTVDILATTDVSIVGTAFHDVLGGGFGNDTIDGLGGSDDMAGGKGNDTYIVESKGDIITEFANEGVDTVNSSADYILTANIENLTITGTSGRTATGNELNNIITGNAGNNIINGAAGNDVITGGLGTDNLTGGLGNDIFKFGGIADSVRGSKHDTIADFTTGDKIDLSLIDANSSTGAVNDAFSYIGAAAFTKVAGQLRYDAVTHNLTGDVNGDGGADFEINLVGVTTLTSADFVM